MEPLRVSPVEEILADLAGLPSPVPENALLDEEYYGQLVSVFDRADRAVWYKWLLQEWGQAKADLFQGQLDGKLDADRVTLVAQALDKMSKAGHVARARYEVAKAQRKQLDTARYWRGESESDTLTTTRFDDEPVPEL